MQGLQLQNQVVAQSNRRYQNKKVTVLKKFHDKNHSVKNYFAKILLLIIIPYIRS